MPTLRRRPVTLHEYVDIFQKRDPLRVFYDEIHPDCCGRGGPVRLIRGAIVRAFYHKRKATE